QEPAARHQVPAPTRSAREVNFEFLAHDVVRIVRVFGTGHPLDSGRAGDSSPTYPVFRLRAFALRTAWLSLHFHGKARSLLSPPGNFIHDFIQAPAGKPMGIHSGR